MKPKSSLLLLFPLVLLGCKKSGEPFKPVASTAPPAGWTVAKDAESGLALNLPPAWRVGMPKGQVGDFATGSGYSANPSVGDAMGGGAPEMGEMPDMSGAAADPNALAAAMEKTHAEMEKKALAELRTKGILIQAVDDSRGTIGEDATRFYVQEYKDIGNLEAMKTQEKELLMNEGSGEAVTLPVGNAWMYQNKGRNRIGDMERHVSYLVCDGGDGYAIRFVSTNNPTVFDAFHRQVAKSLRKAKK